MPIKMCDRPGGDQQCCIRLLHVTINDKNDNKHDNGYQHIVVYNYKGELYNCKFLQYEEVTGALTRDLYYADASPTSPHDNILIFIPFITRHMRIQMVILRFSFIDYFFTV